MKKNLLKATLITTLGAATLSCTERGVIIEREDVSEEKAFFVNLIQKNKEKQKPLEIKPGDVFDADRKMFFWDESNMGVFDYAQIGDTIVYSNPRHNIFIDVKNGQIHSINGVSAIKIARQARAKQK